MQSCNVKDVILEPPLEFWNIDTQFGTAREIHQLPCKFTYYKAQWLINMHLIFDHPCT